MISVAIIDDGEPTLPDATASLRPQVDEIVLATGPRTPTGIIQDLLSEGLVDKVLPPGPGTGAKRVRAITNCSGDIVLTADSDTLYMPGYAQAASRALENPLIGSVKAGQIMPLDPSALAMLESAFAWAIPYEFALGFRKEDFLAARIHLKDYSYRWRDIGLAVATGLAPMIPVWGMSCKTRLPTHWARELPDRIQYLPGLAVAGLPVGLVSMAAIL